MNCKNCGQALKENDKFCMNCGTAVEAVVQTVFPANQTPLAPNAAPNQTPLAQQKPTKAESGAASAGKKRASFVPIAVAIAGGLILVAALIVVLVWKPWAKPAAAEQGFDPSRYELVTGDYTWNEAFEDARSKGGYLARIDDPAEFEALTAWLESQGMQRVFFRIGGRRELTGTDYYWVDENNQLIGSALNRADAWCSDKWRPGEPSYSLDGTPECFLELYYSEDYGRWVLNDVANEISYPTDANLKGYLIEYP